MENPNWIIDKAKYWHNLPSPARPWPSEVKWFEKYIIDKKAQGKKDALVLGSTVEFRSVLHKHGMNVHVVDFSRVFYNILTETQKNRMKYKGVEKLYEQNWLTMDLGKQFDLIFGDWVPGVLHTKDYDLFYQQILKHLKNDGLFIGRECVRPNDRIIDLDEVVAKHIKKYLGQYNLYESSMQYFYAYRMDKDDRVVLTETRRALKRLAKTKIANEQGFKYLVGIFSVEKNLWSVKRKKDFEAQASKYFDIIAEHHVIEPSSEWYPIYVMRKKEW